MRLLYYWLALVRGTAVLPLRGQAVRPLRGEPRWLSGYPSPYLRVAVLLRFRV